MKLPVSRRGTLCHGFALAILTLAALPIFAQQRVPAVPIGTLLEAQLRKEEASFDPHSVVSVNKRLTRLRAIATLRTQNRKAPEQLTQAYKASSNGKMKTVMVSRKKVPGEGWTGAQLFYLQQRAYPFDRIDPNVFGRAAEHRDRMQSAAIPLMGKAVRVDGKVKGGNAAPQNLSARAVTPPVTPPTDDTPIVSDLDEQTSSLRWQPMGPGGYGGGTTSWRVGTLAYDPFDTTGNTLYASSAKGGIWRTRNNGQSWQPLTDKEFGLSFSCVVVSPFSSNVIFAGSGDYNGGNGPGFGVLKSVDGGATWQAYGKAEFGTESIRAILPHRAFPNIVFATGGRNGLFRSIDDGETWTKVMDAFGGSVSNVVFNSAYLSSDYPRMYASVDRVGIFVSEDDGQTWVPMPGAPTGAGRFDVATSKLPSDRKLRTLYVMQGSADGTDGIISKGEPPANTPTQNNDRGPIGFTALPNSPRQEPGGRAAWDQKWYNFYIGTSWARVRDPGLPMATPPLLPYNVNQDVIYVGLIEVWSSVDSGALWQHVPTHHVDQHSITVSPFNPREVLMGSDGGVRKIILTDPGTNPLHTAPPDPVTPMVPPNWGPSPQYSAWAQVTPNRGLDIAQFYDAGFSPRNFSEAVGGTQDNSTQYTTNALDWFSKIGGDGGGCGVNFLRPGIQYGSTQGYANICTVALSYPNNPDDPNAPAWVPGRIFNISLFTLGDIVPFIANGTINAGNPEKFMFATNFLYEFDSTTFRWTKFRQRLSDNGYIIGTAAAPSDPRYIYAGTLDGQFWYSSDGGRRFTKGTGLPDRSITDIMVSPTNPKAVVVTVGGTGAGHIYRTNDVTRGGWSDISSNLPDIHTSAVEVLPRNNGQEIFVGTDVGIFYTNNGGRNWYNATRTMGLPNVDVRDITFMPQTGYLHIATFGRGMWRLPILDGEIGAGEVLIRIQTYLDSYRGDKSRLTATVEFLAGNSVVLTSSVRLTAAGYIIAPVELAGTFDIRVTIPGFLRKRLANVYIGEANQSALNLTFDNGDVNGDNAITDADWRLIQPFLGTIRNDSYDVDGDGRITSNDIRIIQRNLGKVGGN